MGQLQTLTDNVISQKHFGLLTGFLVLPPHELKTSTSMCTKSHTHTHTQNNLQKKFLLVFFHSMLDNILLRLIAGPSPTLYEVQVIDLLRRKVLDFNIAV